MDNAAAMTPQEIQAATDQLITNVQNRAVASGENVESRQEALAPGLATASNNPGGYNYQRVVQPTIAPLATALTTDARRAVFRQALADAAYSAQTNYENEKRGYNERYRQFQRDQAERQRERQRQAERQARAAAAAQGQIASLRAGGGRTVGDVVISSPKIERNNSGGYNFFDANGTPITWQQYQQITGEDVSNLVGDFGGQGLGDMFSRGISGAFNF